MAGADDIVKAALKLIAGGAKEAAPKARLPMDLDNRMYRASEMGFDPTRRYYHLTRKDFDSFKLGADPSSHTGGGAIWLREDPRYNISAHQVPSFEAEGARDIPLFIRPTKELPTMEWSLLRQQGKLNDQFPLVVTPEENKMLRDMGYSHASLGGETVVFDPKDLRSPHAAFDPDEAESADYMKSSGGSIRQGYGPGGWVDDVVKMAGKVIEGEGDNVTRLSDVKSARARDALIKQLKSSINQVKSGYFQAGRQALINQKSLDLHKSGMLPLQQGTIVTPPSTWDMPGDWRVSGYWYDEKDPRRFGYKLQNESGQTYDAAASDPRAGLRRDNPYSFGAGFKAYAGPNADPPKPVAPPVEKPATPKPPEVLDAINKEYEGLFGSEDPFKPRAHGGRIAKGPGGWLDDVVRMAGKVISGEGEEAAKAFRMPRVRPSTDNIHDVGSANFDYYDVVGNKIMPIKDVFGGVDLSMPDQRARVDALKAAMSDPEKGYISRIIVDDEGNVIEGQHRFDAFRELGAPEIPVTMLRDKSRGIDVNAMRSVIQSQGGIHPDQAKQIVDMILEGNPEDYEPPQGFEKWWNAGVGEYNKQRGRIAKGGGGGFLDDALRMAGKAIFGEGEDAAKAGIRAYHASPHDFDKFEWSPRTSMTGEGAQSYGAGLYFAESPSVSGRGGTYDKQFTRKLQEIDRTGELGEKMGRVKIGGKPSTEYGIENDPGFIGAVKAGNVEKYARERLDRWHELSADEKYPYRDYATEKMRAWQKLLNDYSSGADVYYPMKARIYETNIAADPEKMMRWDEPLKDQPVEVMRGLGVLNSEDIAALQAEKRAIESKLQGGGWNDPIETQDPDEFWSKVNASVAKNSDDYSRLAKIERELSRAGKDIPDVTSGKFYKSSSERPENISLELRDRGVPGIQFWDGNSRGKSYLSQWRTDPLGNWTTDAFPSKGEATEYLSDVLRSAPALKGDERFSRVIQNPKATSNYVVFDDKLISIIRKYGIAGASAMLGYNLMEQLDPKQALAASMADQDYQASRPQRSMGGNNSISGALNVARGLNGGE